MVRPTGTATVDAWTDGKSAKFQSVESDDRTIPTGMLIVADDEGAIRVASQDGKCFQMTRSQYSELQHKRIPAEVVGSVKVEKIVDEDGGKLLGFATRHYRMKLSVELQEASKKIPVQVVVDEEVWAAPTVPEAPVLLNMMFTQTLGTAEVDKALEFPEIKGFRFKRTVVVTLNGEYTGQSSIEVKDYRDQSIPPSAFRLDMPCSQVGSKAP